MQPHGSHLVLTLEQTNKRDQKGHRLLYFQNNSIYFINEFDSSNKWSFAKSIDVQRLRNVIFLNKIFVSEHSGVLNARAGHTGAILAKNAQTNYALSFKAYVACTQKALSLSQSCTLKLHQFLCAIVSR